MKIIIVDDEMSAMHIFLNDVIGQDVDYKFFKDDRDEVCDYVVKNSVTAAFLDINMPKIDGVSLAEALIELRPEIKIVFITGLDVTMKHLPSTVSGNTIAVLYKPYEADALRRIISSIDRDAPKLTAKMFGTFDCFFNDTLVRFSSRKSKELFALLITYNGRALTMSDAISQLWPDMDTDKSKPLYRDAVWRLRKTLNEINFNCVNFERAQLTLIKENISCDFWDYLENKYTPESREFLKSYNWAAEYFAK